MKFPAFEKITLEFLSPIEVHVLYGPNCDKGEITFCLLNEDHHMTLAQLNTIYGLPCGGDRRIVREFKEHDFCHSLTIELSYKPFQAKANQ